MITPSVATLNRQRQPGGLRYAGHYFAANPESAVCTLVYGMLATNSIRSEKERNRGHGNTLGNQTTDQERNNNDHSSPKRHSE